MLVVCLKPSAFSDPLLSSIDVDSAQYILLDEDGRLFDGVKALGDKSWAALSDEITREDRRGSSGVYDDGSTLYCYVCSQTTGWYHVVYVGRKTITGSMILEMKHYILRTSILLVAAMLLIAALFSRALSEPINKLIVAVKQIEQGEFGQQIEYRRVNEMGYLIDHFNKMNRSIQRLIQENYQVKLREKDTEIMSLNTQFNPHYLYNTLNAIQWVALRGDAKEAGNMIRSLSLMMRYTSDQKQERTLLRDDVEWMKRYLYLMEARHGDLFRTEWQIDPGLEDMLVPKLFLQPLVENCILHGFKDLETGGLIMIRGREEENSLVFTVQDNGCGMEKAQLNGLLNGDGQTSIGLANVQRRIQLICGAGYGLEVMSDIEHGSAITVKISKESSTK